MTGIQMTSATEVRVVRSGPVEAARRLLRLDAALCAASGAVALLAARPLAQLADGDRTSFIRLLGGFLLLVAADLLIASTVRSGWLAAASGIASGVNAAWVAATVAVVASGFLTPAGAVVALGSATIVAALAWKEAHAALAVKRSEERVAQLP